jgi:outer membrane immunogenic protein
MSLIVSTRFSKVLFSLSAILLASVALPTLPAKADAEMDALQARLAAAEKENIRLKAERLEQENARLREEASISKARVASGKKSALPNTTAASVQRGKPQSLAADGLLNDALKTIPKDDPRREMTAAAHVIPVSPVSPVVNQWSGVYAGINAGYGTGEVNSWSNGPLYDPHSIVDYRLFSGSTIYNGPVVGGQIGYNYELANKVVLGIEADMAYADINDKAGNSGSQITNIYSNSFDSSNQHYRSGVDWIGTARLRLGYDLGTFMPYVTGGLAYGGVSNNSASNRVYGTDFNASFGRIGWNDASNNSSVQVGWGAGGGAELKVADSWSIRGEYLYTQLGSLSTGSGRSSYAMNGSSSSVSFYPYVGFSQGSIGPFGIHQARVGLNYYTGWGISSVAATR